jgi:hypothetical protein
MPVGDWIAAGKAGAKSVNDLFAVARDNSPDYGMIAKTGMNARSKERQVATNAKKNVINAGIAAEARVRQAQIKADKSEEISDLKTSMKRKAGIVGALGAVAGGGLMAFENNRAKKLQSERDAAADARDAKSLSIQEGLINSYSQYTPAEFDKNNLEHNPGYKGGSTVSTNVSDKATSTASPSSSGITPASNAGASFDISELSDEDKRYISFTVSGEAARGTDDEFGVAGVVINRMRSKNYPGTAKGVAYQPKQFEAVEIGNATFDSNLESRLFSPGGLKKLQSALDTLNGRDSFKGQALLKNRVESEDPMFNPKGNFFHHSWQN